MIRAIETSYRGYRFRSRLEARWAVFFDELGLRWEYEREGYHLGEIHYLPDFWLPGFELFVEVKGSEFTGAEMEKCRLLADASGHAVMMVRGLPYEHPGRIFCWDLTDGGGGSYEGSATFLFHKSTGGVICHDDDRPGRNARDLYLRSEFERRIGHAASGPFFASHLPGWQAARSARFEHGERP